MILSKEGYWAAARFSFDFDYNEKT